MEIPSVATYWKPVSNLVTLPQRARCQVMYLLFIAISWGFMQMTQLFSIAKSTTLINVLHGVVSRQSVHVVPFTACSCVDSLSMLSLLQHIHVMLIFTWPQTRHHRDAISSRKARWDHANHDPFFIIYGDCHTADHLLLFPLDEGFP